MKLSSIPLTIFFLVFSLICAGSQTPIEQQTLEEMFGSFVKLDHFGYTLLGLKPVALTGHFVKEPWGNILHEINPAGVFWKRWRHWKEYSASLNFPDFLILEEPNASSPNIAFIFLVHKPSFKEALVKYRTIFEEVIGTEFDENRLISALENHTTTLQGALKYNEMLLGILLGFGVESSHLYAQRQEITGPRPIPLALRNKPKAQFHSVDEELLNIKNQFEFHEDPYEFLYTIDILQFASPKDSLEAKRIRRLFESHREKVIEYFHNKSYFEGSVRLLMGDSNSL